MKSRKISTKVDDDSGPPKHRGRVELIGGEFARIRAADGSLVRMPIRQFDGSSAELVIGAAVIFELHDGLGGISARRVSLAAEVNGAR